MEQPPPAEALDQLLGRSTRRALVLGDDVLTEAVRARGHEVVSRPLPPHDVDVVVVGERLPADLDEIARVLRPGGHLGLLVRERDHGIPWARKLDRAIGATPVTNPVGPLGASGMFGPVEKTVHRSWQQVNRDALTALLPTWAPLVDLDEADREERIAAALALYDDYGRGIDGMQLPWLVRCYRAGVVDNAWLPPRADEDSGREPAGGPGSGRTQEPTEERRFSFDADEFDDTGMLLIDFR